MTNLREITIVIKGAGEMASAVAWRLYMANFKKILMLDVATPLAVRRKVSFCEALYDESQTVEGVKAIMAGAIGGIHTAWEQGRIAVAADPKWLLLQQVWPGMVVDAILAKKNLGTRMTDAELVIGLGPGFTAEKDVHDLGRILTTGSAQANTGVPGAIAGYARQYRRSGGNCRICPGAGIAVTGRRIFPNHAINW